MDIIMHYKQLWHIEDAFGEIKGTLKARPVFHWTDSRIIGHSSKGGFSTCNLLSQLFLRSNNHS
jgi:hypothetical protein